MAINYYAVSRTIGGRMIPRTGAGFGNFKLLNTVGAALGGRPRSGKSVQFDYESDALLVAAFEEIRDGSAPERILWDPRFANRFQKKARELGVHAPAAQLNRRLLSVRKNKARYESHGIALSPTTQVDPQPSIVPQYAHVIEFALVRLRYRYGASIDDILLDPDLGQEFERTALQAAPDVTPMQLRLGALYLRKTRYIAKNKVDFFEHLNPESIQNATIALGSLETVTPSKVSDQPGLFEVLENGRFLYIARNENLREVVEQFTKNSTLDLLANEFWTPNAEAIQLRAFTGDTFEHTSIASWQLRLISMNKPVFNWPVLRVA